mmetsp:Transcript_28759/g.69961  ORF Transcript_28759/g.69961 Transcript_28759/m.69961 type:complete len:295 (-) Transcript_28759:1325-2209(-)
MLAIVHQRRRARLRSRRSSAFGSGGSTGCFCRRRHPEQHVDNVVAHVAAVAALPATTALLEVDHHTDAPVLLAVANAHQSTRLQKRQAVRWIVDRLPHDVGQRRNLVTSTELGSNDLFHFGAVVEVDFLHLHVDRFQLLAQRGRVGDALVLPEAALDQKFRVDFLHAQQVEQHVVANVERRRQAVGLARHHLLGDLRLNLLVDHQYDNTAIVEAAAAGATTHLNVLATAQVTEVAAVELAHTGEHHRFRRHVQSGRECLGGKQCFQQALLKQNFNHLFQQRQQAAVVYADAAFE